MENPRNSFANVFVGPEIKQCLANRNVHSFKLRLKKIQYKYTKYNFDTRRLVPKNTNERFN